MANYIAFDKEDNLFYATDELSKAVYFEGRLIDFPDVDSSLDWAEDFTSNLGKTGPCGVAVHYCPNKDRYFVLRSNNTLSCRCAGKRGT